MHYRKLSNRDWKKVEERIEKRLSSWKGKYLSVGGHEKGSIYLVIFMMSFFEVPRGVYEKIDAYRSRLYS
jgi:hypothetical protein